MFVVFNTLCFISIIDELYVKLKVTVSQRTNDLIACNPFQRSDVRTGQILYNLSNKYTVCLINLYHFYFVISITSC